MADDRAAWGLEQVVAYVTERGYRRVTLQFPDELLPQAPAVAAALQQELRAVSDAKVYVLADTTYNPLSIDEVAAQHVNADCVIHYGHASLTPVTRVPALCVLPRAPPLDAAACAAALAGALAQVQPVAGAGSGGGGDGSGSGSGSGGGGGGGWVLVAYDQAHAWQVPELQAALREAYQGPLRVVFADVAPVRLDPPAGANSTSENGSKGAGGGCCQAAAGGGGSSCAAPPEQAEAVACCAQAASGSAAPGGGACLAGSGAGGSGSSQPLPSSSGDEGGASQQAGSSAPAAGVGSSASSSAYAAPPLGGLVWQPPAGAGASPAAMLWLGPPSSPALTHLQLTHAEATWLSLDPAANFAVTRGLCNGLDRLLKRRYYLVEKSRGANIVGLLVGTLGAAGYLEALAALRALVAQAGKKSYTLLMGKPSPAKLANFPEVDVFVMVAEPQGLLMDSKEYLAPLVTPHEALLALTGAPLEVGAYCMDYGPLLAWHRRQQQRAAGGGGGAAAGSEEAGGEAAGVGGGGALVAGGGLAVGGGGSRGALAAYDERGRQVAARSAAEYLTAVRSYKGLETPATGAEIKPAELAAAGRAGRAAGYVDEPAA